MLIWTSFFRMRSWNILHELASKQIICCLMKKTLISERFYFALLCIELNGTPRF